MKRICYVVVIFLLIFSQGTLAAQSNIFCLESLPNTVLEEANKKMLGGQELSSVVVVYYISSIFDQDGRKTGQSKVWMADEKMAKRSQITFLDKPFNTPFQYGTVIKDGKIYTNDGPDLPGDLRPIKYTPKKRSGFYIYENMNFNRSYEFVSFAEEDQFYILKTKFETMISEKKKYHEEMTYFINKDSLLVDKIEIYEERPQPIMNRTIECSKYVETDGFMVPTFIKSVTYFDGKWIADETFSVENIEFNVKIPEEIFLP